MTEAKSADGLKDVRVRAFIDFWNFQLNVNKWDSSFSANWKELGPWLA